MRSGKWWPWTAAWGLAAATMAVLLKAGTLAATAPKPPSPTDFLAWSTAIVTLGGVTFGAFRWASKKTHDPPARLAEERIGAAKRLLAMVVQEQWTNEARFRDWEKLPLIQVRWRAPVDSRIPSSAGIVKNPPLAASSAEIVELAEKFRACEPRRLVILGGPGAGKTTLAVRLLLELLIIRAGRVDEPVPVTLPVAQWNTDRYPRLHAWLAEQLYQDYPGLRWLGVDGVRQFVDLGHVLPILDGLDELPESAQATVIERLNDSLGARDSLILTSRTDEYTSAVGDGRALDAASVLEPLPVTPRAAADYLIGSLHSHQANRSAWHRALEVLRTEPDSVLAEIAATPLGLWLIRTVYVKGDGDPDELTDSVRFPTADKLRAHLLGHLIEAILPTDGDRDQAKSLGLSHAYRARQVERWLGFLAHHLSNQPAQHDPDVHGTRDFEWWRLAATTGKTLSRRAAVLTFVLAGAFVGGFASTNVVGLVAGLGVGLVVGFVVESEARRSVEELPGVVALRTSRRGQAFKSTFRYGLIGGLALGIAIALVACLALGMVYGLAAGTELGLLCGTAFSLAASFVCMIGAWVETPSPAAGANSPESSLRSDRRLNVARIICGCLVVGVMFGLMGGLTFSPGLTAGLMFGLVTALVLGPLAGLLSGRHRAWLAYEWATLRLSREGVLPRKLMPFLDDMHRLGLLRAVGRIYQFRHAELQDHLASAYRRAG